jgi:hypothetical protein
MLINNILQKNLIDLEFIGIENKFEIILIVIIFQEENKLLF